MAHQVGDYIEDIWEQGEDIVGGAVQNVGDFVGGDIGDAIGGMAGWGIEEAAPWLTSGLGALMGGGMGSMWGPLMGGLAGGGGLEWLYDQWSNLFGDDDTYDELPGTPSPAPHPSTGFKNPGTIFSSGSIPSPVGPSVIGPGKPPRAAGKKQKKQNRDILKVLNQI